MRNFGLQFGERGVSRILCLGAHCDDIEIGCGGTLLALLQSNPAVSVHWVVFTSTPEREHEARNSAQAFLAAASRSSVTIHNFRDGFLPYLGAELKERFEELKTEEPPDLIFTHYREDLHQDHRLVAELTWNTFRNHLILEYEIPKYDGDFGRPNVFVPLDDESCQRKIEYVLRYYPSQKSRSWFSANVFSAMLRLRGMEANAPSSQAEAFYGRKLCLNFRDEVQGKN